MPALLPLLILLISAGQALALDAWRDRRGLFLGLELGAGSGGADSEGAENHLGFNFHGRVGGGLSRQLTLDLELGLYHESYESKPAQTQKSFDVSTDIYSALLGANFFFTKGLYLRGLGGIAQISTESDEASNTSEMGLALGLGAGFEFFANADLAVGVGGDYRRFMFDKFNYNLISFGVTASWY